MEIEQLIWDADNTIWDWVGYAAKAYPAMAECISKETGISLDDITAGMKKFYTEVGTLEDAGLIQGLERQGIFAGLKDFDREKLILKVKRLFTRIRNNHFKIYPGVTDVIKKCHEKGIKNIILTDAPAFHAASRIKRSGVYPFFSEFYCLKSRKFSDIPQFVLENQERGKYKTPFRINEIEVEKPHTALERIIKDIRQQHLNISDYISDHVGIIGDNDRKDMALARKYNCLGIHANWGEASKEDIETLLKYSPVKSASKNLSIGKEDNAVKGKIVEVEDPEQLKAIFEL